jgi:hypothetical protein
MLKSPQNIQSNNHVLFSQDFKHLLVQVLDMGSSVVCTIPDADHHLQLPANLDTCNTELYTNTHTHIPQIYIFFECRSS